MEKEKVVLYHINDIIKKGTLLKISEEMPEISIDEILIGVETTSGCGNAFGIDNPEVYERFRKTRGVGWWCGRFRLLYKLSKEKARDYVASEIEAKEEVYISSEDVKESLRETLISHINKS